MRAFDTFRIIVQYCFSPDPIKAASLTIEAAKGTLDFSEYCENVAKLKNESAISYLVRLPEVLNKRK